jgi:protein-L-isoaspartate(D-aspartate) O-methyltransferase
MIASDTLHDHDRRALIGLLRTKGIKDENVLNAIASVPRHLFVEEVFRRRAYEDTALPIGCQQTISQPYTVAFMTQLLEVRRGDKVLEVGTGSGYQAAVLAAMGARVFTIERHFDLLQQARRRFDAMRLTVASMVGDGSVGWSQFAPYERIIVTAGAPDVPPSLLRQMAEGGILVIPVGDDSVQTMRRVVYRGGRHHVTDVHGFKFVPLIGKEGWQGK